MSQGGHEWGTGEGGGRTSCEGMIIQETGESQGAREPACV